MNKCLTHNQEYPIGSWCVYCGVPSPPLTPPYPIYPTIPQFSRCQSCGTYFTGTHACWTYNPFIGPFVST